MTSYAGLDVSQQETQICIIDAAGAVRWTGKARSRPAALATVLRRHAPDLTRAVLESGPCPAGCAAAGRGGLPAVCMDAGAAHGTLKQRRSKTDRGDALGLARLAPTVTANSQSRKIRGLSRPSVEFPARAGDDGELIGLAGATWPRSPAAT